MAVHPRGRPGRWVPLLLVVAALCTGAVTASRQGRRIPPRAYHRDSTKGKLIPLPKPAGSGAGAQNEGSVAYGTPAVEGQFQFAAWLAQKKWGSYYWWGCGGTLVKTRTVVTAAHCVTSKAGGVVPTSQLTHVVIGLTSYTDKYWQALPIVKIVRHTKYNPYSMANDIALLFLGSYPACTAARATLPSYSGPSNDVGIAANETLDVAGWGTTESQNLAKELRWTEVVYVPWADCDNTYKTLYGMGSGIDNTTICAGGLSDGKDSCRGDSGGPLLRKSSTTGTYDQLVGVVSYGPDAPCGAAGYNLGAYTSVAKEVIWMQQQITAYVAISGTW